LSEGKAAARPGAPVRGEELEEAVAVLPGEERGRVSPALAASKILKKIKDVKIHRGPWSDVQDLVLTRLVAAHGPRNWSKIARLIPGRVGKQCRER